MAEKKEANPGKLFLQANFQDTDTHLKALIVKPFHKSFFFFQTFFPIEKRGKGLE